MWGLAVPARTGGEQSGGPPVGPGTQALAGASWWRQVGHLVPWPGGGTEPCPRQTMPGPWPPRWRAVTHLVPQDPFPSQPPRLPSASSQCWPGRAAVLGSRAQDGVPGGLEGRFGQRDQHRATHRCGDVKVARVQRSPEYAARRLNLTLRDRWAAKDFPGEMQRLRQEF